MLKNNTKSHTRTVLALTLSTVGLFACSSDKSDTPASIADDDPAFSDFPLKGLVGSNYFQSSAETYNGQGELKNSSRYEIDYATNTIKQVENIDYNTNGTGLAGTTEIIKYSDTGLLTEFSMTITLSGADEQTLSVTTTSWENGKPKNITQDYNQEVSEEYDTSTDFFFGDDGLLSHALSTDLSAEDKATERYDYVYENGKLISVELSNEIETGKDYRYTYTRNSEGQISEIAFSLKTDDQETSGFIITTKFSYDQNGNIVSEEEIGTAGEVTSKIVYTYEMSDEKVPNLPSYNMLF